MPIRRRSLFRFDRCLGSRGATSFHHPLSLYEKTVKETTVCSDLGQGSQHDEQLATGAALGDVFSRGVRLGMRRRCSRTGRPGVDRGERRCDEHQRRLHVGNRWGHRRQQRQWHRRHIERRRGRKCDGGTRRDRDRWTRWRRGLGSDRERRRHLDGRREAPRAKQRMRQGRDDGRLPLHQHHGRYRDAHIRLRRLGRLLAGRSDPCRLRLSR